MLRAVALTLWEISCRSATEPLPRDAAPLTPPAIYRQWWSATEACSGRRGDFDAVRWYVVPGGAVLHRGEAANGYWSRPSNVIVLASDYARAGYMVRHEMLHALLQRDGHPRDQFLGACAALVVCAAQCATDAGPWQRPGPFVVVPADSVVVTTELEPRPRDADGIQWVGLRILVRNPSAGAVFVEPAVQASSPPAFAFDVQGPSGGLGISEAASDSSRFFFAPRETKSFLFEFYVADELTPVSLTPGQYVIRGGFSRHWAAAQTIFLTR